MSIGAGKQLGHLIGHFFKVWCTFWGDYQGFSLVCTLGLWGYTIMLEAMSGHHRFIIINALKFTFLLFIWSEAIFFVGIFWCFFDAALSPSIHIGCQWPPIGIVPINP
jgi:cytochrome c oxidase subunit 3